jgi:Domain of unknown function (DUF1905)
MGLLPWAQEVPSSNLGAPTNLFCEHPFKSSFMAMGDARHMLPIKTEICRAIGKEVGETAKMLLEKRIRNKQKRRILKPSNADSPEVRFEEASCQRRPVPFCFLEPVSR